MSAVMSTLSMISGGRRAHRKLTSRKSGQFSDAGEERTRTHHDLKQQRSASLQTLEAGGGGSGVVNLENLEAKMASIEVSLAGRRRSAGRDARELDALRAAVTDKDSLIQSLKKQLSASLSAARLATGAGAAVGAGAGGPREEPAALSADERRALRDRAAALDAELGARRRNIQELRTRLEKTHVTDNIDTRIQQAELQYQLGREELELLTLSEQARALALLIEHAAGAHHDTLYSMIRELGGQGTLVCAEAREGSWGAAPRAGGVVVDWAAEHSPLRPGDRVVEVDGALVVRGGAELARAAGAAPARLVLLRAPPRTFTHNEAAQLRSELGALKASAEDAEKAKESLRTDNTRLTHRISYLEEQVAELLIRHNQLQPTSSSDSCITVNKSKQNVTNINIGLETGAGGGAGGGCPARGCSEVQVFQKGPDITALVAKLPGLEHDGNLPLLRPRSNASGASSRAARSPRASPPPPPTPAHAPRSQSSHSLEHRGARMRHSLSHHCIRAAPDYGAETDAAIRMIERNQRHMEKQRLRGARPRDDYLRSDSDLDPREAPQTPAYELRQPPKKAAERIEESIKKTNWAERKTLSIIEQLKRSQRLRKAKKTESAEDVRAEPEPAMYRRIDGKVLENAHKSSRRTARLHSRSARSSELESEYSDYPGEPGCGSERHYRKHEERREGEGRARPTPPRKPLRLSLHKARSAHSLLEGGEEAPPVEPEPVPGKRPVKRTHGAGAAAAGREARATPRPHRKLNGLTAPAPPDALYPSPRPPPDHQRQWC